MPHAAPLWVSHDAGTLPWLAVAGYLVGSALCLWQVNRASLARERLFWLLAGLAMLALGINKQLDLQTALTAALRTAARDDGWYGQRRAIQKNFVIAVMVGGASLAAVLAVLVPGVAAGRARRADRAVLAGGFRQRAGSFVSPYRCCHADAGLGPEAAHGAGASRHRDRRHCGRLADAEAGADKATMIPRPAGGVRAVRQNPARSLRLSGTDAIRPASQTSGRSSAW